MKKYIIGNESIGDMAVAAASQQSRILIEKDKESSFYIAHVDDNVIIPDEIKALEMITSKKSTDSRKFLDLRLCVEIPESINKKKVENILCEEISKTLKSLIDENID